MSRWHDAHLAGRWYEGTAATLRAQVDALLGAAHKAEAVDVLGIVVPHAGFAYSGRAAAHGYATLRGAGCDRVVILAPSHHVGFRGVALLDCDGFETPLGQVHIDRPTLNQLRRHFLFDVNEDAYADEHSLEIQLPFLQRVLPEACVVPLLFGELTDADYVSVADVLRSLETPSSVFVVSSDFTHYGRRFGYMPFVPRDADTVRASLQDLDGGAIGRVCSGDAGSFARYVRETGATICGRIPITTFLTQHQQRTPGELLQYYTSLDVTGDFEHCVSYASIAFTRP